MKRIILTTLACLFLATAPGQVQHEHGPATEHADTVKKDTIPDYCAICIDRKHEIVYAPYHTEFKKQLPFLAATSAFYLMSFILTSANPHDPLTEEEIAQLDKYDVNRFDRPATENWSPSLSKSSDLMLIGVTILPVIFLSEHHTKSDIIPLSLMAVEAYLFNYGLTAITKNLTKRIRPYAYNTEVPPGEKMGADMRESFFSGHTSQTAAASFLFANVINDYHPNMRKGLRTGMWIFAATIPAIEAILRVQSGKHFPTDVITGYIVGAASGWLIPKVHRYQKLHYKFGIGFLPMPGGMQMSCRYRF